MAGFTADITKWVNRANGNVDAVIRKIAFDLGSRIIMRTPVDTGRARGNWMFGSGTLNTSTQAVEDKQGRSTSNALLSALADYDPKSEQSIFITNSVPYIGRLEYGSSKQAPSGMVRLTVAEFLGITKDAVTFVRAGGSSE